MVRLSALALLAACADLPVTRIELPGSSCGAVAIADNNCVYTAFHCTPDLRTNGIWLDRDLRRLDPIPGAAQAMLGPYPAIGETACIATASGDETCAPVLRYEPATGPWSVVVLGPMHPHVRPGDSGSPTYTRDGRVFGVETGATLVDPQEAWITIIPEDEKNGPCHEQTDEEMRRP